MGNPAPSEPSRLNSPEDTSILARNAAGDGSPPFQSAADEQAPDERAQPGRPVLSRGAALVLGLALLLLVGLVFYAVRAAQVPPPEIGEQASAEAVRAVAEMQAAQSRLARMVLALSIATMLLLAAATFVFLRGRVAELRLDFAHDRLTHEKQRKLASLGTLASGVAHEIRNPLTAIKARLFALERKIDPDSEARPQIKEIRNEIDRLERIVKEFLLFARPPNPEPTVFEVGPVVDQVVSLLEMELLQRGRIRLKAASSSGLSARADPEQLKQVLINLIQNAAAASEPDQEVSLEARALPASGGRAAQVAIDVVDRGCGIPSEIAPKLFDPFFTTKPKGSGLGLSIAKRIAKANGGDLVFVSKPGQGSAFTILLPAG